MRGVKGSARLKRRKIGGERKHGCGSRKVWWRWVKRCVWVLKPHPRLRVVLSDWLSTWDKSPSSKFVGTATLSTYHRPVVVVVVVGKWQRRSVDWISMKVQNMVEISCVSLHILFQATHYRLWWVFPLHWQLTLGKKWKIIPISGVNISVWESNPVLVLLHKLLLNAYCTCSDANGAAQSHEPPGQVTILGWLSCLSATSSELPWAS